MTTVLGFTELAGFAAVIYLVWRAMDRWYDGVEARREYRDMEQRFRMIEAMHRHPSSQDGWKP
jgi:hypothetical protein